jgi:hypothetical protein
MSDTDHDVSSLASSDEGSVLHFPPEKDEEEEEEEEEEEIISTCGEDEYETGAEDSEEQVEIHVAGPSPRLVLPDPEPPDRQADYTLHTADVM